MLPTPNHLSPTHPPPIFLLLSYFSVLVSFAICPSLWLHLCFLNHSKVRPQRLLTSMPTMPTQGLHVQCRLFKSHTVSQPGNSPSPMSLIISYDCWFVIRCFRLKNRSLLVLSCPVKLRIKFTFFSLQPSLQNPILKRWIKSLLFIVSDSYWIIRIKHEKLF